MHLLKYFDKLSLRPENAKELKRLIVKLALLGKVTYKWRNENTKEKTGLELVSAIKNNTKNIPDKLSKRDRESKIEILESYSRNIIPNSWALCALHDLANFWNGKAHEKGVDENGKYLLVNSRFVSTNGEKFKRTNSFLSPLKVNDIAIVMSDVPDGRALARCFLVKENEKYTLNQRIGGITLFKGVEPEFMVMCLDRNQHYLNINDGKKQTNLKRIHMISCPISLPPLAEQKAIVKTVNQLMEEVDQLEGQTKTRVQLRQDFIQSSLRQLTTANSSSAWKKLKPQFTSFFDTAESIDKLKEAILQLAVQGKLTMQWRKENPDVESASALLDKIKEEKARLIEEKKIKKEKLLPEITKEEIPFELPEGWLLSSIKEIAYSTEAGKSPKCLDRVSLEDEWGVIKTTSVQRLEFKQEENKAYPQGFITGSQSEVNDMDLLITRAGPFNRTGIVAVAVNPRKKLLLSDKIIRINLSKKLLSPHYLAIALSAGHSYQQLQSLKSGMAKSQVNISQDKLKSVILILPPLLEQKNIVNLVNQMMASCDKMKSEIEKRNNLSKDFLRSSIREVMEETQSLVSV